MKKYIVMFSSHLKGAMAYRADTLLNAGLSFFFVLISYLLWKMLIPNGGTLNGFTLPAMVTYTMISTAIAPFTASNDAMFAYADEIRTGKFARYLYTPVRPFGVFLSMSLAKALPQSALTVVCCVLWSLVFHDLMQPLSLPGLLTALPILLLMVVFVLLLNYLIATLAFKFTDILGVVFIRGTLVQFFSGALAPLEVLFGGAPLWSPFYYLVGYPAQLIMGRPVASPLLAFAVLGGSTLVLLLISLTVARGSRRFFEGVGA